MGRISPLSSGECPHLRNVDRDDAKRFHRLPRATREVRNVDGRASPGLRLLGDLAKAAPRCEVVDVHVERQAVLQAVDPAQVHEEIHPAMSAGLLREFAGLLPERMAVLLAIGGCARAVEPVVELEVSLLVRTRTGLVLNVDAQRIVHEDAVRALNRVDAAVWMRHLTREVEQKTPCVP